jgi:hypothetical protein
MGVPRLDPPRLRARRASSRGRPAAGRPFLCAFNAQEPILACVGPTSRWAFGDLLCPARASFKTVLRIRCLETLIPPGRRPARRARAAGAGPAAPASESETSLVIAPNLLAEISKVEAVQVSWLIRDTQAVGLCPRRLGKASMAGAAGSDFGGLPYPYDKTLFARHGEAPISLSPMTERTGTKRKSADDEQALARSSSSPSAEVRPAHKPRVYLNLLQLRSK